MQPEPATTPPLPKARPKAMDPKAVVAKLQKAGDLKEEVAVVKL